MMRIVQEGRESFLSGWKNKGRGRFILRIEVAFEACSAVVSQEKRC
jgi:hypothetical protein